MRSKVGTIGDTAPNWPSPTRWQGDEAQQPPRQVRAHRLLGQLVRSLPPGKPHVVRRTRSTARPSSRTCKGFVFSVSLDKRREAWARPSPGRSPGNTTSDLQFGTVQGRPISYGCAPSP